MCVGNELIKDWNIVLSLIGNMKLMTLYFFENLN